MVLTSSKSGKRCEPDKSFAFHNHVFMISLQNERCRVTKRDPNSSFMCQLQPVFYASSTRALPRASKCYPQMAFWAKTLYLDRGDKKGQPGLTARLFLPSRRIKNDHTSVYSSSSLRPSSPSLPNGPLIPRSLGSFSEPFSRLFSTRGYTM